MYIQENRLPYDVILFKKPLYGIKNNFCRVNKRELIINITKYNGGKLGKIMTDSEIINILPKQFDKKYLKQKLKEE